MKQKGVYPYDYMDTFNKFNKTELPTKEEFFSILSNEHIADVFENFRKTCLQHYKLDPCHYFTSPGLSWDAMLKMTDIRLELMTDIDMFQFIERVWEEVYLILPIDLEKQITNT